MPRLLRLKARYKARCFPRQMGEYDDCRVLTSDLHLDDIGTQAGHHHGCHRPALTPEKSTTRKPAHVVLL